MTAPTRDNSRRPTHPGEVLRLDVLPELNVSQDDFAKRLGVSRLTVSQLLNEHRAMSASMAVRLERELGTRAEQWLAMQQAVDLWEARAGLRSPEVNEAAAAAVFTGASDLAMRTVEQARMTSRQTYTIPSKLGVGSPFAASGTTFTEEEEV